MKCPLNHRCKCQAKVRIIAGKYYKRLEFYDTHDETNHANDYSKNLKCDQIVTIQDAVMVAFKMRLDQNGQIYARHVRRILGASS